MAETLKEDVRMSSDLLKKMPKQSLELIDYLGPIAAAVIFFSTMFILSVTVILWCFVTPNDDKTVFAKWGLGPQPKNQQVVYRDGVASESLLVV
ncbi:unnamed protein product [Bursaphelenchus xylophilus]|uniref:(pine wood nematode) hypothetical protein n=1 Tax=Bursaphelenchus xylophilus TaxID=6326 RepID=A0A1I7SLS5_BURXY|nr:unnamed protein product [Bursaphelenchus xylophilus]CAG9129806.1 unnamed protein product [Bursaphelenchus xylophilus]